MTNPTGDALRAAGWTGSDPVKLTPERWDMLCRHFDSRSDSITVMGMVIIDGVTFLPAVYVRGALPAT